MKKVFFILTMFLITISVFGQAKEIVTCQIWKTESFCKIPESVNVPWEISAEAMETFGVLCDKLDAQNLVGIWITFEGKSNEELYLTSHFNNISLVSKDSKEVLHPIAYMIKSNLPSQKEKMYYITNESTFGKCVYKLNSQEKYDLVMLFKKAEEIGRASCRERV